MPGKFSHSSVVRYRGLNKPDESMEVVDVVPIYPPKDKLYRGHRYTLDHHREIAWSVDYRGDNDDVATLLFVGAGYTLVKKVLVQMFGTSSPLFSGLHMYRDYHIHPRQGKAWVRIAVELMDYCAQVMRIEDLGMVLARKMEQECLCNIKQVKLNTFLNL